ncbi:DNA helicase B-like [Biomphalaria glabrata]|uniref:DNA helicase B-like n=1 Tax=Biomphalaria glabrata TaxID=6526 RepID=A0A9W3AK58_BIOGL|nr:DNA helicase B-like [Biomphalaria glabrata]XP_055887520.1 DNA helicase B-like [Biomphalaria glabrata]
MSQFQSPKQLKTIKGALQIPYKSVRSQGEVNESDCSDDDEEEDLDDIFCYDPGSNANSFVSSRLPRETKVEIKSSDGRIHPCTGRFPLTQTFWEVEVKMANGWLKQAPKYFIMNVAERIRQTNMVTIFLSECLAKEKDLNEKENAVKACFETFCRNSGEQNKLSFETLEGMLKKYLKLEKTGCCLQKFAGGSYGRHAIEDHSQYMMYVIGSELGSVVLLAASHPKLVSTSSELLPYSFPQFLHRLRQCSIFRNVNSASPVEGSLVKAKKQAFEESTTVDQKVKDADEMARLSPWEFAFKDIIARKLKIYGTEARLQAYIQGGYFSRIPEKEKDAMYIYEVLKEDARRNGNMYLEFNKLRNSFILRKLGYTISGDQRWADALNYLETNNVIKREVFNYTINIFLRANWQAEVDTAEAINQVLYRHRMEPLQWDIDLSSTDFNYLRQDDDQRKATQLICQMPITVLSGKGGCGKTTVVTKLLKHLCDMEEIRLKEMEEESEFSDSNKETVDGSNVSPSGNIKKDSDRVMHNVLSQVREDPIKNPDKHSQGGAAATREVNYEEKLRQQVVADLIKILENSKEEDSKDLKDFKKEILLTAPTGKAARLLGGKAKLPSATLHSVIMSWRNYSKQSDDSESAEEKTWIYQNVKILVVDECSLVSVRLFSHVMNILLENANLKKIILLGDIRQLPSIEPGEFLKDIFKSFSNITGDGVGFSIELTQNHRSESKLIVENATKISNCQMPTFDPNGRFFMKEISDTRDDNERDQAIRHILNNFIDVKSDIDSQFVAFRNAHCEAINELCSQFYNGHSIATSRHGRKKRWDFQIGDKICLGRNNLVVNSRGLVLKKYLEGYKELQIALEKASQRKSTPSQNDRQTCSKSHLDELSALELITGDEDVYNRTLEELKEKDKRAEVQQMERIQQKTVKREEKSQRVTGESLIGESKEKLCNGEVFFIMDDIDQIEENNRVTKYLVLSDRDPHLPRVVCAPLKQLRRICRMKHSWARTIHTYQGSESDTVVYVLGQAVPQNWQHVYTAITRGKKSVCIVGKYSELLIAVNRKEPLRSTRLGYRLKEMINRHADLMKKSMEDFVHKIHQISFGSPDASLSDFSESLIHELDESVAKVTAGYSSSNGKPIDVPDELDVPGTAFDSDVEDEGNSTSASSTTPNGVKVHTKSTQETKASHLLSDREMYFLLSSDDNTDPTHSEQTQSFCDRTSLSYDSDQDTASYSQPTQKGASFPLVTVDSSFNTSRSDESDLEEERLMLNLPTQKTVSRPEFQGEDSFSCSDDSDLDSKSRLFPTKRQLSDNGPPPAEAGPSSPAVSQSNLLEDTQQLTPPGQIAQTANTFLSPSGLSPSKRLCTNILSTPFQDTFKTSLSLNKEEVSHVRKKL